MQLRAYAIRTDQIQRVGFLGLIVAVSPDHIHIDLRDYFLYRNRRIVRVVARAQKAFFFPSVPYEEQRALWFRAGGKGFGYGQQRYCSRSVIVSAVPIRSSMAFGFTPPRAPILRGPFGPCATSPSA